MVAIVFGVVGGAGVVPGVIGGAAVVTGVPSGAAVVAGVDAVTSARLAVVLERDFSQQLDTVLANCLACVPLQPTLPPL